MYSSGQTMSLRCTYEQQSWHWCVHDCGASALSQENLINPMIRLIKHLTRLLWLWLKLQEKVLHRLSEQLEKFIMFSHLLKGKNKSIEMKFYKSEYFGISVCMMSHCYPWVNSLIITDNLKVSFKNLMHRRFKLVRVWRSTGFLHVCSD